MKKLYVLIRKDLSHAQRAVQGGHAIAQFLLDNPSTEWDNGTLVFLGVSSEKHLYNWKEKLYNQGIEYSEFREPDIGDQLTALASVSNPEPFRSLSLI